MPLVMLLVLLGPLIFFNLLLVLLGSLIFTSTVSINFSSAGTFLHLNAISYAFSSTTILVLLQFCCVLVQLTSLHLDWGSSSPVGPPF